MRPSEQHHDHHGSSSNNMVLSSSTRNPPPKRKTVEELPYDTRLGGFPHTHKAMPENPPDSGGDHRHWRMMKNRESAARSRARKQVYIHELELEVRQLLEENSRQKKELEELRILAEAAQQQKHTRNTLQRSSSAPF